MSLSYDQYSFVRMVFEEAYIPELYRRRRAERISQSLDIDVRPYFGDPHAPAIAIPMRIVDYSTTGFGLRYHNPVDVGDEFTVDLPRPNAEPLMLVLRAVRCTPLADNQFEIGLAYDSVLDSDGNVVWGVNQKERAKRIRLQSHSGLSVRTKILFLLFGVVGVALGAML